MNFISYFNSEKNIFENVSLKENINSNLFAYIVFILKSIKDFYSIELNDLSNIDININLNKLNSPKFIIILSDSIYKFNTNFEVKIEFGKNVNSIFKYNNSETNDKLNFIFIQLLTIFYSKSIKTNNNKDIETYIQPFFTSFGENVTQCITDNNPQFINTFTLPSFDELFIQCSNIFSHLFEKVNNDKLIPYSNSNSINTKIEQELIQIENDEKLKNQIKENSQMYSYLINQLKNIHSIYKFPLIKSIENIVYSTQTIPSIDIESIFQYSLLTGNLYIPLSTIYSFFNFKNQTIMQANFKLYYDSFLSNERKKTYSLEQVKSVSDVFRLEQVVGKFLYGRKRSFEQNKLVRNIVKQYSNTDDITFYKTIHNYYSPEKFDRSAARIREITDLKMWSEFEKLNIKTYLDFGGGDGTNAYAISKKLNLTKGEVFVSDIQSWFGNENVDKYSDICTYRYLKTYILPFESNSIQLITMFQVLHHIENIELTLKELYRVLAPGGIFYIREHDCDNSETATLIDIEHSLQECSKKDYIPYEYLQTYYANYFSRKQLHDKLIQHKFIPFNINNTQVESMNYGETKYYVTVWKKE
jgi:ubiquinone/menaquinone biosynthesis C-methylase UbiE